MNKPNEGHLDNEIGSSRKVRRRLGLLIFLTSVAWLASLALFIPTPPALMSHSLGDNHSFYLIETYESESIDNFSSKIISQNGEALGRVITYFLVGGGDQQDMLNQFYPEFSKYPGDMPAITYSDGKNFVSFHTINSRVILFEYKQEHINDFKRFIGEKFDNKQSENIVEFTDNEFRDILKFVVYDKSKPINTKQPITDIDELDRYIIEKATIRGYSPKVQIDTETIIDYSGIKISKKIEKDLQSMIDAAKKEGHDIKLLSGYRSVEEQREIFNSRFISSYDIKETLSGLADSAIEEVLDTTAPPGMSRHHSGYAVDLSEEGVFYTDFKNSDSFNWLSADNYKNAKQFGFVPSYPEDAENQGPNPEAWEYTYVGKDITQK